MADCGGGACSCLIQGGDGIIVSGAGTRQNPYLVRMDNPGLSESLRVQDTETVNLTLLGQGTPVDPFILSALATVKLTQLVDIQDPEGGPVAGEVPTFVGSGLSGHFEFKTPPPAPAGSVNVGQGLGGTGSALDPIYVKTASAPGGSTAGLEVYVDSAGNLRAVNPSATSVDWGSITGKPSTFPPSAHNQAATTITTTAPAGSPTYTNAQLYLAGHEARIAALRTDVDDLDTLTSSGTVYDSTRVMGHKVFSGAAVPTGTLVSGDLWFRPKV
jgi:hypothetical protein